MPPRYRLSRADFTRMRGFLRAHGTLFSLSYGVIPERQISGMACVISAKIAPRAAVRNRVKRRVRAALSAIYSESSPSSSLVFYAKKSATEASYDEVVRDITSLLARAGIHGVPIAR